MFLRETRQKRADGRVITYLQLAESVWDATKGRSTTRVIFNCGRADDPAVSERLRRLAVLALLLERMAEHACADTWRNIRDDLKHIKLAQLLSPNGTLWQVTEPTPAAAKRLKVLKIDNPPPVLDLA